MSGLKEIRTRIGSIRTTRQVTSAMKMVSAAKLKKAQDAVISFRPYALKFKELFFQPQQAPVPLRKILIPPGATREGLWWC